MSEMVDTMVLIYGSRTSNPNDLQDLKDKCTASDQLIRSMNQLLISAISWLEFARGVRATDDQAKILDIKSKLRVLPIDFAIADRANTLLKQRQVQDKACEYCLASPNQNTCRKCKSVGSAMQRLNDAIIAATAEETDEVTTLYSYDGGVIDLAKYMKRSKVLEPPHPHGILFAHAAAKSPP